MLIQCPECKKEVSSRSVACPYCGCPIAGSRVQTIEKTSKNYKVMKLIGVLGFLGSIGLFIYTLDIMFLGLLAISAVIAIGADVGAWWENG